jgi:hypothetical protein
MEAEKSQEIAMSAAAKLPDHIDSDLQAALHKFSAYKLTVNDMRALGFETYDDIVVELRKLNLPIPTKPRTLDDPSIQAMRSKAFDKMRQWTREHQAAKQSLKK